MKLGNLINVRSRIDDGEARAAEGDVSMAHLALELAERELQVCIRQLRRELDRRCGATTPEGGDR